MVAMRDGVVQEVKTHYGDGNPDEAEVQIFHVHGGAFSSGTDAYGAKMCELMAKAHPKTVVYGLNFRKDGGVDVAVDDLVECITTLRTDKCRVLVSGGSSGGWFAAKAVEALEGVHVDGLMLFCPILYPEARKRWLESCLLGAPHVGVPGVTVEDSLAVPSKDKARKVLDLQNAFAERIEDARLPTSHIPTLMVLGGKDENMPPHLLARAMPLVSVTKVHGELGHRLQEAKMSRPLDQLRLLDDVTAFINSWCV